MRLLLSTLAVLLTTAVSNAQLVCGLSDYQGRHIGCEHGLQGTGIDQFTYVPPPANYQPGAPRDANIVVNYTGFTPEAQAAFQYAVDIWASLLNSPVTIVVNATFESLGGNTLGFAGADGIFRNFPGAIEPNTFYPQALANKLRGSDNDITSPDIFCSFNSDFNWYYGTDGNTPGGQYDFATVVLHELCHGLGFFGSANVDNGNGFIGFLGDPVIYDIFVETGAGTAITALPNGTSTLGNALTGNDLFWNGPEGVAGNNNTQPRMYAPSTWAGGSSYSHLNEGTYSSGSINALMTPFLGTAEAIHDPGPIVQGIFTDIGWTLGGCSILSVTPGTQTTCNPATNTYNQQLIIEYELEPQPSLLVVNGSLYTVTGSPQTISLNGLPSDGQPVDVTVSFNAEPSCTFTVENLFTAPEACCSNVRITSVDTDSRQVTLTNFGSCAAEVSNLQVCSDFFCATVGSTLPVNGTPNIAAGNSYTFQWNTWSPDPSGTDLALYVASPNYTNPDDMIDFVQWGSAGNGREPVADAKGIWTAGNFVTGISPYTYIGDGVQTGVAFWEGTIPPCNIDQVVPVSQLACDPATNHYAQTLSISYTSPPAGGDLIVNGQSFPIEGSPQLIALAELDSDGNPVDVNLSFSADPGCSNTFSAVFTAPALCFCPTDLNQSGFTDIADLLLFLADFGCIGSCLADFNNDGETSSGDLLDFLSSFDAPCP